MRKIFLISLFTICYSHMANAACYADYKAKKDEPLRLHYGVSKINTGLCKNREAIKLDLDSRLQTSGWILLRLLDVFDNGGLNERRDSAGIYFLKY